MIDWTERQDRFNVYSHHVRLLVHAIQAMDGIAKRKVTVKVTYNAPSTSSRPPSRTASPRPPSPIKFTTSAGSAVGTGTTFRPKAKVNSAATIRKSPSVVGVPPRASSPSKFARAQNGTLTPSFQPRVTASTTAANVTIRRPQTPVSAPVSPNDARQKASSAQSDIGRSTTPRIRDASSLHHAISFSSLQKPTSASQDGNVSPSIRIRSKVSNLSKNANETVSPSLQPIPQPQPRVRSPSTSSSVSQMRSSAQTPPPVPPPQFYPITAGSPAANPHRYVQRSPPATHHAYQGLGLISTDLPGQTRARGNSTARVKLPPIPPPPLSPPGSTLSFSSKSSVSQSSHGDSSLPTTAQSEHRRQGSATDLFQGNAAAAALGSILGEGSESNSGLDSDNDERKVRAAAKTNRKMADLEITNRSLLSINSSLEATKNKQAKEIRELRRKLRESRLILPPSTFRAVKSSMGPEEDEVGEDEDDDSEVEDAAEGNGDEIYKRVKLMLEGLISSGKKALETKIEDFPEGAKGVAKVLTAEEVQSWHRSNVDDIDGYSDGDSMSVSQADISITSSIDGDDDDDDGDDEDEGNASFLSQDTFFKPSGPPIHISEAV
ncbi:hypothetical protein D9611_005602 [Ephemerocybe angulata]|uniref:Uncharacterized protein n=1 Tax=Ephemerocybe angulata TaxID=980116 RepID=A0A8H5BHZ0_9AGAR|nr:hypothetical protein D9611_005602 [Tulosesus angulatus]